MRELLTYLAMFQVVLSVILNSWEQASPCGLQTVILFLIPVFGPMCFLAAMTILDDAARYTKEETGNHLNVQIGPMRFTFSESV